MKLSLLTRLLLLSSNLLAFLIISCNGNQIDNLKKFFKSRKSANPPRTDFTTIFNVAEGQFSPVYVGVQHGLKEADKIGSLPGQPQAGRALFHYFVESPQDSSTKPLVLWLNGGPGCSSFGYRAMEELGPFRVNSGRMTLFRNDYAWNNVVNVIFLESPAIVGFSYSNTTSDYENEGDKRTAEDSYKFLINRDFFIIGESYAGHYVPQLASTIISNNKVTNQTKINLKGIAVIGNAWIDDSTGELGIHDYAWTHGMNSDETNAGIHKYCDFSSGNSSSTCDKYQSQAREELGNIDIYNIYASLCKTISEATKSLPKSSVDDFDPCSDNYVETYLNLPEVQAALRVIPTEWSACGSDGRVPVTSSRYPINYTLILPLQTPWRPWYSNGQSLQGPGRSFA
ncbi:unnamed protein product [Malus baccata var. baccata]